MYILAFWSLREWAERCCGTTNGNVSNRCARARPASEASLDAVVRPAQALWGVAHDVYALFPLEQERGLGADSRSPQERCRCGAVLCRLDHRSRPPARDRRPKKAGNQAIGRSRGGLSTKIHATVEALGNLLRLRLTAGQVADITGAAALIEGIEAQSVIADKGYDGNAFVDTIEAQGAQAVIPPRSNRYDRHLYKDRNLVERFFCRLKQFRRIATRYEKLAQNFMFMLSLASVFIWLA